MSIPNCDCSYCKNNHDFAVDAQLMQELLSGKVTIFAGAGISTESKNVLKTTVYESIAIELNQVSTERTFPDLMTQYCDQPNGRFKLLKQIKDRFEHIDSFPELQGSATRFHRELGTFFFIKNIISTNWDTYFEDYCHATPFVNDLDIAFWEAADRRVLKIHGSISNLSSIVATTTDYKACEAKLKKGVIGAFLKQIIATQTVLFVGYSFSDTDFLNIYNYVKKQMKGLHKQAYVVTPFSEDFEKFKTLGLIPIKTDGAFFLKQIKVHAIAQQLMFDDHMYRKAKVLLDILMNEHGLLHDSLNYVKYPEVIFAASYQDGLIHSLQRAIHLQGTGQYSDPHRSHIIIQNYLKWQKSKRKHGVYEDVAYMEGYINGLCYLSMTGVKHKTDHLPPLYFVFGNNSDINNIKDLKKLLSKKDILHKAARKRALRCMQHTNLGNTQSVEFHHPPWL